jgi:hypothetical protein
MAEATRASSTTLLAMSPSGAGNSQTSSTTPAPIDRSRLMKQAHRLAADLRRYFGSYREALAHALRGVWGLIRTRREFAAVRARVRPRILSPEERRACERATRRCGASFT